MATRRTTTATKTRPVASPAPTLGQADEARLARERQALERGEVMTPDARLDRDLAHLATPDVSRRVQSRRRRAPEEVGLVYRGKRTRALLVDGHIDIILPDEDNDEKVMDLQETIPGLDEDSQRAAWASAAALRNRAPEPYVPVRDRLVVSGQHYHFEKDKTVLVHEDDADWLLAHPVWRIERADGLDDDGAGVPPIGRHGRQRGA